MARAFLLGVLELIPLRQHPRGIFDLRGAEDVRMPVNQLVRDVPRDRFKIK